MTYESPKTRSLGKLNYGDHDAYSVTVSHLQESRTFVRDATGLVRSLSPFDSMAINISVITVGCMFYCLAFVGASFGTNIAIGFVLAAALSLPFVLLYSTFS